VKPDVGAPVEELLLALRNNLGAPAPTATFGGGGGGGGGGQTRLLDAPDTWPPVTVELLWAIAVLVLSAPTLARMPDVTFSRLDVPTW
jgi:hypothetical protein